MMQPQHDVYNTTYIYIYISLVRVGSAEAPSPVQTDVLAIHQLSTSSVCHCHSFFPAWRCLSLKCVTVLY